MSDIITLLPDSVANQIAAGEVVDRPASAVKELLENAVDAEATHIQLIIKDAGRTLIQVIDNGCGMSEGDARLCFERHATSKIHKADDLFAIRTMGFRGEALASIAAVAQVELKTKTNGSELGSCVTIEGSSVVSQEPCTCPLGTSIAVKNLFYNIPARRNFLKRDSIEFAHIDEIFRRIALINYNIHFTLHNNGKLIYDLKGGNLAQRIAGLFGNDYRQRLYPVEEQSDIVNISGYVCKPEYARRTRGEQYLFVNHRFIKHPSINAAIEKAYAELIPERTYPTYFVCLEVDPSRIDVNIHPTKTEVRFIDETVLFSIVRATVKRGLGQYSLANEIEFNPIPELDFNNLPTTTTPEAPKLTYDPLYNPFISTKPSASTGGISAARTGNRQLSEQESTPQEPSPWDNFFEPDLPVSTPENLQTSIQTNDQQADNTYSNAEVIHFNNRYLVAALKSGLIIIDHQRAHERILYEQLMARASKAGNSMAGAQQLLFPINCSFTPSDAEIINELMPNLRQMGFDMEVLGLSTFVVSATPCQVNDNDVQAILSSIVADYKSNMMHKNYDGMNSICMSIARQSAIKQGSSLHKEEMQSIIAALFCCHTPMVSPSGLKTMVILSDNDIAEKFK